MLIVYLGKKIDKIKAHCSLHNLQTISGTEYILNTVITSMQLYHQDGIYLDPQLAPKLCYCCAVQWEGRGEGLAELEACALSVMASM